MCRMREKMIIYHYNKDKRFLTEKVKISLFVLCLVMLNAALLSSCGKRNAQTEVEEGWGETQSITVATDWAGIDFISPEETFVMDDGRTIDLTTYRYRMGEVEALYKGEDYEIVFKKSNRSQEEVLTENNLYSNKWDEELNDITVHCLGADTDVNIAYFDKGDEHFSVICHIGNNDAGLTKNELYAFLQTAIK